MFVKSFITAAALCLAATSANAVTYGASFSGANENPPNMSTATGFGTLRVIDATTIFVDIDYSGLTTGVGAGHIHCCVGTAGSGTVGVAVTPSTLPGFPAGLNAGSYSTIPALDLTSNATYTGAFRANNGGTAASAASVWATST